MLAGGVRAQSTNTNKAKPAKPPVDCSTADDAQLTAAVKDKLLKAPSLKDLGLNATVSGGVATLTGTVSSGRLKGTATRVAKGVKCVKSVNNQITVAGAGSSNSKAKT
jgi:osmotically-inducible protein OsmY